MSVTVLIPAHNEAEWIERIVANLAKQTSPPSRIVVAANGCSDDTAEIAAAADFVILGVGYDELRQREPALDRRYTFGVLVEAGGHCSDPGAYVAALVAHAQTQGADLRRAKATGFDIQGGRLRAVRNSGRTTTRSRRTASTAVRRRRRASGRVAMGPAGPATSRT